MAAIPMRKMKLWQDKIETEVLILGSGPPLVYLHGPWGLRSDREFLEQLAGSFTVYAPKHPGTSDGDPDAVHQIDNWLDLIVYYGELFDRLTLTTAALAGHSFGGMVACEIAAAMPERVSRLVLIDPVGLWRDDLPVKNWMIMSNADLRAALFAAPKGEVAEKFFEPADRECGPDRRAGRIYLVAGLHRQIRLADSRQGFEKAHPPHRDADIDHLGQSRRRDRAGLCAGVRPADCQFARRNDRGRRPPAALGAAA